MGRGRGESPDDRGRVPGLAEPPSNGDRNEGLQGHSMACHEELCPGHRKGVQGQMWENIHIPLEEIALPGTKDNRMVGKRKTRDKKRQSWRSSWKR